jgi:hypothetical protein
LENVAILRINVLNGLLRLAQNHGWDFCAHVAPSSGVCSASRMKQIPPLDAAGAMHIGPSSKGLAVCLQASECRHLTLRLTRRHSRQSQGASSLPTGEISQLCDYAPLFFIPSLHAQPSHRDALAESRENHVILL